MYFALIFVLLVSAAALVLQGVSRQRWPWIAAGAGVVAVTWLFFTLLDVWGELLWFRQLGYADRFWTAFAAQVVLASAGAAFGAAFVALAGWWPVRRSPATRIWPPVVGAVVGGVWGIARWETGLLYWYGGGLDTEPRDPILGKEVGFYLFELPFYDAVFALSVTLSLLALITATIGVLSVAAAGDHGFEPIRLRLPDGNQLEFSRPSGDAWRRLTIPLGILALVAGWGWYLSVFHLMYSPWGAVFGAGWTDVWIRRPALYATSLLAVLAGLFCLAAGRNAVWRRLGRRAPHALGGAVGAVAVVWFVGVTAVPTLVQWLRVEPNEITVEKPYIEHAIAHTRQGFRLDDVEERPFQVSDRFGTEDVEQNRHLLSEVRLWDPRALDAVYQQFQEIRLYYEFADVDVDRYTIDGAYRQVMVSAREMDLGHLPARSRTFVNERFKYTHGYGLTLAPVSDFTSSGLPNLLVKDLPPVSTRESLRVTRPEIYYGELTDGYVVVATDEAEFDYPSGDQNVYTRYSGTGGVPIDNLWRRFLFGWKFGGTRLLFSGYPNDESRVMFHREITERIRTLAPFLVLDRDPYVVLRDDGRMSWIVDAYTSSSRYPYSEPFSAPDAADELRGANYVRNSVKVVVDAFEGDVSFYVFDESDPLIRAWRNAFPGLFRDRDEMPDDLRRHVRYPEGFLRVQGLVYAKYHMTDPTVFYNQEDLWVRATEKYYQNVQPVSPYYVMWEPPESDDAEFILMQPYTPKNKQVLIGWMAGMCDGENYGRLLAYRFPKEKRVLGTQQVETKIDQDAELSQRLTLWDQRGSKVIRGNLLVIPIDDTLLYVEPIYLQSETSAYPELRLVVVMHDDRLSYAQNFEDALLGLLGKRPPTPYEEEPPQALPEGEVADLVRQAGDAFEDYLRLQSEKRFGEAAERLDDLHESLRQLQRRTERAAREPEPDAPDAD